MKVTIGTVWGTATGLIVAAYVSSKLNIITGTVAYYEAMYTFIFAACLTIQAKK